MAGADFALGVAAAPHADIRTSVSAKQKNMAIRIVDISLLLVPRAHEIVGLLSILSLEEMTRYPTALESRGTGEKHQGLIIE